MPAADAGANAGTNAVTHRRAHRRTNVISQRAVVHGIHGGALHRPGAVHSSMCRAHQCAMELQLPSRELQWPVRGHGLAGPRRPRLPGRVGGGPQLQDPRLPFVPLLRLKGVCAPGTTRRMSGQRNPQATAAHHMNYGACVAPDQVAEERKWCCARASEELSSGVERRCRCLWG